MVSVLFFLRHRSFFFLLLPPSREQLKLEFIAFEVDRSKRALALRRQYQQKHACMPRQVANDLRVGVGWHARTGSDFLISLLFVFCFLFLYLFLSG